jgi:hypothetical protein
VCSRTSAGSGYCLYKKCTYRNWGHYATSRKVATSILNEIIGFFNWPNLSSRIIILGSTPPLIEISTRNLPAGKVRPARKADNLIDISVPIV